MKKKKSLRWDLALLGGVLLAGACLGLVLLIAGKTGERVEIRVSGQVVETLPLDQDRTYTIESPDGGTNRLVIENGRAWMEAASCPDGLCLHMGAISQTGQTIVCLPNQVVVEVTGGTEASSGVDLVAG